MSPESQSPPPWRRLRALLRNPISLVGIALALVSLGNIFFFSLVDFISAKASPYIGILAYMVAPAFLIFSLVLIAAGYLWARHKKMADEPGEGFRYPRIDLNDPNQRSGVVLFGSFLLAFLMLSAVGSYKAYEFTDSVRFCGQTCHTVMHPEFTAYSYSPHARVPCVACHVGSGATWYVNSKLSGARQVVNTIFDTYPRPIPTPVHDLRPAQQTCEACHWPEKFYGAQLKVFVHYASDETNTPRQITLLIKTGGGNPATGAPEGIHWHMNIANKITYVAADEERQVIPYVRVEDRQGRVTEYYAKDSTLTRKQIAEAPKRLMDCVDCHNRPTHIYTPPDQAVDNSMAAHRLDTSLPYLKQQAVVALTGKYSTTPQAMKGIAKSLEDFYESKYPDLAKTKELAIENAVGEVQAIFRRTTFPEMKVTWQTHPDNLGHFYFKGCFRCHDGQHVSADGKVVPKDCNTCHTVLSQEEGKVALMTAEPRSFQHPIDIGDLTQVNCSDCHTGGENP
jgi:NapC/NirT cytochrome c family, N-terminal region/Cytochrome c3